MEIVMKLNDSQLDSASKTKLRKELSQEYGISIRTIQRYEAAYQKGGYFALVPAERKGYMTKKLPDNFQELVKEAIILKKQVPTRSVSQIIWILENEGRAEEGIVKRSTMQRYLANAGFSKRQMKKYTEDSQSDASYRFAKPHRMMLVQADIKYGVGIIYKDNGKNKTAYLSSVIDDHSRFILWSEWYEQQDEYAVTDVFRKAILKHGKFDRCYTDNGTQYIATQLKRSCTKLGIQLIRAKPRSGKSKGKIERFHQTVDQFIAEIRLEKPATLAEINRLWMIFLNDYYHKRPHEGIREYYESMGREIPKDGITPEQEWNRDNRPLCFIDAGVVAEAFRYHETRIVDKGGLISFKGQKYEVKPSLIGAEVEISYDPKNDTEITVRYKDTDPFTVQPVKIGEYCKQTPAVPVSLSSETDHSRMLTALEKIHQKNQENMKTAIDFSNVLGKENR